MFYSGQDVLELLQRLQAAGCEIKPGKYMSCRAPGQERFTRLKTLGADYIKEKKLFILNQIHLKFPAQALLSKDLLQ